MISQEQMNQLSMYLSLADALLLGRLEPKKFKENFFDIWTKESLTSDKSVCVPSALFAPFQALFNAAECYDPELPDGGSDDPVDIDTPTMLAEVKGAVHWIRAVLTTLPIEG